MPESNVVEVRFGADISGLRSGAREAAGHVDSLRSVMLGMKAEATQTGRAARFFANDIASMIPASLDAKGAIQDLFAIMLSGGAIGVAIGSVKLLVEGFKLLGAEAEKAKAELKKFAEDSAAAVKSLKDRIDEMLLSLSGASAAQKLAQQE